jgi:hypothetical protein
MEPRFSILTTAAADDIQQFCCRNQHDALSLTRGWAQRRYPMIAAARTSGINAVRLQLARVAGPSGRVVADNLA